MADLTDELAGLNENARLLLEKYDGVFAQLDEQSKQALIDIANKSDEGLQSIQTLLDNGSVAEAENALKLGGESLENIKKNFTGVFAGFKGPHSFNDTYLNNWHSAFNFHSDYFEIQGSGEDAYTGIKILKDGVYRCEYVQRGKQNNSYGIVSMNGNRNALEDSARGLWGHDHSADGGNWSKSLFIGELKAGDIISGGYINADDGVFSNRGYDGLLLVTKIGEI